MGLGGRVMGLDTELMVMKEFRAVGSSGQLLFLVH